MNFDFEEEHKLLQDMLVNFVNKEVKPLAQQIDREHKIPDSLIKKMADLGLLGTYIPEEYGGAGMDYFSYIMTVEEVSKACGSTGVMISAHTSLACDPILSFGNEDQKKKYLPLLAKGEKIGCILLTEPEAGSDVANIQTTYKREGDYFILNGNKIFITNGGFKGIGVVFASFDRSLKHKGLSAFIIDLESEGVEILKNEEKMGIRGSYTTAIGFNNVKIPVENLLGKEGDGFKIAMETLNGGRIGIAAQALGIAEGAFERALAYSKERKQFGKPISENQAIQFKLADMIAKIETAKLITYKAAWLKNMKKTNAMESAICKMYASEVATYVTKEAVQIFGGYGYICEYEVERMYRDAKITEIYEGTNEVQRIVISKMLLK
ncbi:acyl-CoA dehydrogenase [Calditerrivibrio nitroreducens]|uniref:Cyclohex-1-ene-1-carbonyl-CoA dehydrogenase n=1 Tax=Calditerrivibrio nitroreducens (strain DSM 19672 / NBRC 101217 / Yu37-1) TaxID=768670 RepID=E4TK05_CALNY|nr:acyl-CoA dehydrogenase [Calditerrivibrio nitroreducens]ADR18256.1 acyl-CoA dehydrogenase domain-containing protein [Calditerrivibrio nitroreducens DSM 19672]